MRAFVLALGLWAAATGASAADLSVSVRTAAGKPVADAVVAVYPAAGAGAARAAGPYRMTQHDMSFDPFVLVVPVGAEVAFPNQDKVRHHVYSFSDAKNFELKLYGSGESRTVRFDKPGVVSLGCNIHDQMLAFIVVVDTPFAAKTDAQGVAVIHDLPAGQARLTVWHPYGKARGGKIEQSLALSGAAAQSRAIAFEVRPAPIRRGAY